MVGLTHPRDLMKTGRFDLSTITSWHHNQESRQIHTGGRGCAVNEGLESAQWSRHLLTEMYMARSSRTNVAKKSLKRPAHVFTDSCSLASTVKKDVGQRHDKRFRICRVCAQRGIPISGKHFADVVADSSADRRSPDENDGPGHSRCVFELSCVPVDCQENLCVQRKDTTNFDENCVVAK